MRKGAIRLLLGALLCAAVSGQAFADALLRVWAESGNEFPIRVAIQGGRSRFVTNTVQTVQFTIRNPTPRRILRLQATISYTARDGRQFSSQSAPIILEVDQTARNCRVYLYIINGYALQNSLVIESLNVRLPGDSSFVIVPVEAVPAGTVLRGQFTVFAR